MDRPRQSGRLRLRPLAEADLEPVGAWLTDSEDRPWEVVDMERATQDLRIGLSQQDRDDEFRLCAIETVAGKHVGIVSWMADWRWPGVYEISELLIAPHERGQGFATETGRLILAEIFETRQARKATATVAANNEGLARIILREGGRREATLRRHLAVDGEEIDIFVFGLLRDEWIAGKSGRRKLSW